MTQVLDLVFHHLMEQARGEPERRNLIAFQCLGQLVQCWGERWKEYQPPSIEQTPPYLECGCIEGDRCQLQKDFLCVESGTRRVLDQAHNIAMRCTYSFRCACRARSVHHVGQILRACLAYGVQRFLIRVFQTVLPLLETKHTHR